MRRAATALLLIATLAMAGATPAMAASKHRHRRNHPTSGVRGVVTAGPVCPVEQIPPDPSCADRPVPAHLTLTRSGSNGVVARGSAADDGQFQIRVAPGHYTLSATSPDAMRCTPQPVDVGAGQFTGVQVICDTGIR